MFPKPDVLPSSTVLLTPLMGPHKQAAGTHWAENYPQEGQKGKNKRRISFQSDEHLNPSVFLESDASTKAKRVTRRAAQGRSTATFFNCSTLFVRELIVNFTLGTKDWWILLVPQQTTCWKTNALVSSKQNSHASHWPKESNCPTDTNSMFAKATQVSKCRFIRHFLKKIHH